MSQPVVLIADKLAQSTVDALGDKVEVRWVDGPNRPELLAAVADADALLVRSATTVDREVLEAAPNLKIVGRAGVGLDNVDIPAATERGVMVCNAPTSNIHSACEHAIALLLSTARQIPAADKTLREGEWKRSSFKGVEIYGKTIGLLHSKPPSSPTTPTPTPPVQPSWAWNWLSLKSSWVVRTL